MYGIKESKIMEELGEKERESGYWTELVLKRDKQLINILYNIKAKVEALSLSLSFSLSLSLSLSLIPPLAPSLQMTNTAGLQ